jgi:phosphoribosylglycinamide formyltransferase-1
MECFNMLRLGILGSTRGTDMMAILAAIAEQRLPAAIAIVISNKAGAGILQRAAEHKVKNLFIDPEDLPRADYDAKISQALMAEKVDLVILIGYMRILFPAFVEQWRDKIINVHPSLLPAYAGGMDQNVHQAVLDAGETETGCTIHRVTAEVDAGPVLMQKHCAVRADDTAETLKARVQALEGLALVEVITAFADEKLIFDKRFYATNNHY